MTTAVSRSLKRHPIALGVLLFLILLVLVFDWNWLRHPVERYISSKTERTFTLGHLDVDLGFPTVVRLRDVYFSNADWGRKEPMAKVGQVEFSVSLPSLFADKILMPRLAVSNADVVMEMDKEGRRNWRLSEPDDTRPGRVRIGSLAVTDTRLRFYQYARNLEVAVDATTFDPRAADQARDGDAQPDNATFTTRYAIRGNYNDAAFAGEAIAGDTLTFQESGTPFPLKGYLEAGTTRFDVDGQIADVVNLSAIDARMKIRGETLANLYPFLLLPLPASPPYALEGHLKLNGNLYTMDELRGKIGSSDVTGSGTYEKREPRPLLTAKLSSSLLDVTDLGPLIGVSKKHDGASPPVSQSETKNRASAKAKDAASDKRVLPTQQFQPERFKAIDAAFDLDAGKLKVPGKLPLDSLKVSLRLKDGVLKLEPFTVGMGAGAVVSRITLDASGEPMRADAQIDIKQVGLSRLLPASDKVAPSTGTLGGRISLRGTGSSVAEFAAKADGQISLAVSRGRVSNLIDAASGLNGGKVIALLAGGDEQITLRCGAALFDVKQGKGTSRVFVIDTEETQVVGDGSFDLAAERVNLTLAPQPKNPGFLSARTPLNIHGSFVSPQFDLEKKPLVARAVGAAALAVIATPLAALIPFIETGPGEDTDCSKVWGKVPAAKSGTTGGK
ncbi:AsmA family protein [Pigmentiphaga litoralis]|uniref:AsmA family protein n=1 Tax=Pigmentiphaga litoralis TaxID=516702 RepID=UPI003B43D4E0